MKTVIIIAVALTFAVFTECARKAKLESNLPLQILSPQEMEDALKHFVD